MRCHAVVIWSEYDIMVQDSYDRVSLDIERARQEGYLFGAKLVRGAYMYLERGRAKEKSYSSPIWDSIEETHSNYDRVVSKGVQVIFLKNDV